MTNHISGYRKWNLGGRKIPCPLAFPLDGASSQVRESNPGGACGLMECDLKAHYRGLSYKESGLFTALLNALWHEIYSPNSTLERD
jgi:hypothetical protein